MSQQRLQRHFLLLVLTLVLCSWGTPVHAQKTVTKVQGPTRTKVTKARASAITKGRRQRIKPTAIKKLGAKLSKSALSGTKLTDKTFRDQLSIAPLGAPSRDFNRAKI
ncbi:MAG: hypothetical protein GY811_24170 [Myxococcales bacterium]|nr:hypothetical protein [Myxococcales bacterium]